MMAKTAAQESDLYQPVKDYLEKQGYRVQGEVKYCDIVATKNDEIIVVELKLNINMTLLIQATERQGITDSVYVAIPKPKKSGRQFNGIKRVLKRLELGLLVVTPRPLGFKVVKHFDPVPAQKRKNPKRRRAVIQEIADRSGDYNVGGISRKKLITAYRDNAILIACWLKHLGPTSPKVLRKCGTGEKTTQILSKNHYGWFQRVERGVYALTDPGACEAAAYKEICQQAEALIRDH
jgi:hypothetical protein